MLVDYCCVMERYVKRGSQEEPLLKVPLADGDDERDEDDVTLYNDPKWWPKVRIRRPVQNCFAISR